MITFRSNLLIVVNLITIFGILKPILLPEEVGTDFLGIFFMLGIVFLLIYNMYALIIYVLFFKYVKNRKRLIFVEAIYATLLIIPFGVLWHQQIFLFGVRAFL